MTRVIAFLGSEAYLDETIGRLFHVISNYFITSKCSCFLGCASR